MGFCHLLTAVLQNQTVIAVFSKIHLCLFPSFENRFKNWWQCSSKLATIQVCPQNLCMYQIVWVHFSGFHKIQWNFRLVLKNTSANCGRFLWTCFATSSPCIKNENLAIYISSVSIKLIILNVAIFELNLRSSKRS